MTDNKLEKAWRKHLSELLGLPENSKGIYASRPTEDFKAGWNAKAQQSHVSEWVPVEDIPEEWKDGRELHLFVSWNRGKPFLITSCYFLIEKGIFTSKSHGFIGGQTEFTGQAFSIKFAQEAYIPLPPDIKD